MGANAYDDHKLKQGFRGSDHVSRVGPEQGDVDTRPDP